jgi:hypothetical protein
MTTPLAIVNLKSTSRPVATIRYFADPKKVTAAYDGLDVGVAKGTPRQLADLLLAYHHDPRVKRVCRTAVIWKRFIEAWKRARIIVDSGGGHTGTRPMPPTPPATPSRKINSAKSKAAFGNGGRFLQAGIFSTASPARRKFGGLST